MKQILVFVILISLFPTLSCSAQFKKNVEQSYLLYNKARLLAVGGQLDSAALYMKKSILLNPNNGVTRWFAIEVYLKSAHYTDFITDIKDYYTKNTLPEKVEDIFQYFDSAIINRAKKNKEVNDFMASYENLKTINRQTVKVDKELKTILEYCSVTDQFVRRFSEPYRGNENYHDMIVKLYTYADSTNMEQVAAYFKAKGFPTSVELDAVTMSTNFVIGFIHYMQDSGVYGKYPVWKYLDSSIRQAVYNGILPIRYYLKFMDNRYIANSPNPNESKQLYGFSISSATDSITKKRIVVYYPEIDDIDHLDERRQLWLQPTLYEESLLDPETRLPEKYKRKGSKSLN